MLEQRISIAAAEERIAELESLGRTVILVALGSRLAGLFALQDGIRPGARAAVQHLLDAQIEPVLLAGDARETCEAIGRSLDIDHIRPEVLPADRGAEVRRLIDAGMTVAVLGHAGVDELALGAADVAVALRAAGSTPATSGCAWPPTTCATARWRWRWRTARAWRRGWRWARGGAGAHRGRGSSRSGSCRRRMRRSLRCWEGRWRWRTRGGRRGEVYGSPPGTLRDLAGCS